MTDTAEAIKAVQELAPVLWEQAHRQVAINLWFRGFWIVGLLALIVPFLRFKRTLDDHDTGHFLFGIAAPGGCVLFVVILVWEIISRLINPDLAALYQITGAFK